MVVAAKVPAAPELKKVMISKRDRRMCRRVFVQSAVEKHDLCNVISISLTGTNRPEM